MVPYTNSTKLSRIPLRCTIKSLVHIGFQQPLHLNFHRTFFFFPPHGSKKGHLSIPIRFFHRRTFVFPWFKLSALWTISKGVLIIRVDRTNFDVVTRQVEKVHQDRIYTPGDQEIAADRQAKNKYGRCPGKL